MYEIKNLKFKMSITFLKIPVFLFIICFALITNSEEDYENSILEEFQAMQDEDLMSNIDDFISLPKGGTSWQTFGETGMKEYPYIDNEGNEWIGIRPEFTDKIKKLDTKEILVQGYMFPLEQSEKQSLFLLGPFPISCPYHPHTQSNLLIEVHADKPVLFSYDAINIRGKLELVPKDDEYNMFYRLKNAVLINK